MTLGYYFYNPNEQKVFMSRNDIFLKEESRTSLELQEETEEATPQLNMNNERQLTPIEPIYTQES